MTVVVTPKEFAALAPFELTARPPLTKKIQKTRPPTERQDQVSYFGWLYHQCPKYHGERVWHFAFMIANGGYRHPGSREQRNITGAGMKRQGLKPGVPDIEIVIAVPPFHGMFLELKQIGARKPDENQLAWHARLSTQGYFVAVCYGLTEAQRATLGYLHLLQP